MSMGKYQYYMSSVISPMIEEGKKDDALEHLVSLVVDADVEVEQLRKALEDRGFRPCSLCGMETGGNCLIAIGEVEGECYAGMCRTPEMKEKYNGRE